METDRIDKVTLQDEVKLYRQKVVLFYLDSQAFDFESTKISFRNPIPVENDEGARIGFAQPELGKLIVTADLAIDYSCEERLLAEIRSKQIYPRIVGQYLIVHEGYLLDLYKKRQIRFLEIEKVILSRQRPSDDRIPALGELLI